MNLPCASPGRRFCCWMLAVASASHPILFFPLSLFHLNSQIPQIPQVPDSRIRRLSSHHSVFFFVSSRGLALPRRSN